jgi:transposase-like protein
VIVVAVRWYLRFGLPYRDVEELLTERGVEADHVTVSRLPLGAAFTPLLAEVARPCRHRVGNRWQAGEAYVKAAGSGGRCTARSTSSGRSSTCSPACGVMPRRRGGSSSEQ